MTTLPTLMPLISRGVPAYTNDDYGGAFPASHANDATYGGTDYWRCVTAPTGNANSGTLTQAVYLAYDLSGVASAQRGHVLVHWDQSAGTGAYDPSLISTNANNIASNYTIDVNPGAGGGSPPGSGWVTKATVNNTEPYHSMQHYIDMTGNNWIRINVTGVIGSAANNNVALQMDVHDAHNGPGDSWFCAGDSITQRGFMYDDQGGIGAVLAQRVANKYPLYYPAWQAAGIGGFTATDAQTSFATWMALFPGKFVTLNYGTNDANLGGTYVTNFQSKMQSMITTALAQGCTVIIPTIPWINTTSQAQTNVNTLNGVIATLIASNPGCIAGPDLYTFFSTHQSDISGDGIHPTDPALAQGNGYVDYRTQWINWATSTLYFNTLQTSARTSYKVRTVLKSPARTNYKVRTVLKTLARAVFKVQLSGVGPQPYKVSGVTTHIKEHPYSTMSSKATVTDANNVLQNALTATVQVTYPDNSTATPQVYWLGSGVYSTIYETKDVGTLAELWTFTDTYGGSAEYKNEIPCNF